MNLNIVVLYAPLVLTLTALCPHSGVAQDTLTPQEQDKLMVRSYAKNRPRAAATNFNQSLNLAWPSLHTLGGRIDAARQAGDPVALAHTAGELNVAETVSGKKTDVRSDSLLNESTELGKLRGDPSELNAILQVHKRVQSEADLVANLHKLVAEAEAKVKRETSQPKVPNLPPTLPDGSLIVYPVYIENYTEEPISIFMNGRVSISVPPLEKRFLNIVKKPAPVVLHAYSSEHVWGPRTIWETSEETYRWVLLPPKMADNCGD